MYILAVVIAPVPFFFLISYSFAAFIFEKGSYRQSHSFLGSHHPVKKLPPAVFTTF